MINDGGRGRMSRVGQVPNLQPSPKRLTDDTKGEMVEIWLSVMSMAK